MYTEGASLSRLSNHLQSVGIPSLLVFVPVAFADVPTMTPSSVGGDANIGGASQKAELICYSFATHSAINSAWTAHITYGARRGPTSLAYSQGASNVAAWLTLQLIDPRVTCLAAVNCKGAIQYAIWDLFTHGSDNPLSSQSPANDYYLALDSLTRTDARYTARLVEGFSATDLSGGHGSPIRFQPVTKSVTQQFMYSFLALNLLAILGIAVFVRQRRLHPSR